MRAEVPEGLARVAAVPAEEGAAALAAEAVVPGEVLVVDKSPQRPCRWEWPSLVKS